MSTTASTILCGRVMRSNFPKIAELADQYHIPYDQKQAHSLKYHQYLCTLILTRTTSTNLTSMQTVFKVFLNNIIQISPKDWKSIEPHVGSPESGILGLMFLQQQYAHIMTPWLTDWTQLYDMLKPMYSLKFDDIHVPWHYVGFSWEPSTSTLLYNKAHGSSLVKTNVRFRVTLLTIKYGRHQYHANILLYDTLTHILEVFDPYNDPTDSHDDILFAKLSTIYKQHDQLFVHVSRPTIRSIGLQNIQLAENKSDMGFCQPWVFLYTQMRLTFPNQIPESLPFLFQVWLEEQQSTFTDFITKYSATMMTLTRQMLIRLLDTEEYSKYEDIRIPLLMSCIEQMMNHNAFIAC